MPPQTAKSLMKEFRASFRRKKTVVEPSPKPDSGAAAEEEELAKLAELKENLGDKIPPFYGDSDLLSFLRARLLNVKEAEKMLFLDVYVKRVLSISTYEPPMSMSDYNFTSVIGYDKEGSLIRIINVGRADTKGIVNAVSTIEGLKILMYMVNHDMKRQEEENAKSGRRAKHLFYIMNVENLTMSQVSYKPAFDMMMQALKLLQDHYHDVLKKVYFINAPPFFSSVFKLFKPVIKDALHRRIKIFDHEGGKEELLRLIDADVLPRYMGGSRVDSKGDPRCSEFIRFGQVVPENLYATNFLDPEDPEVTVATVPAGATLNFRFPARHVGSLLKWHIQAKANDIGVALFNDPFPSGLDTPSTRRKKEEDMSRYQQLTPIIRSQCHLCPEVGSVVLWFTGNVIIHFDNTYSWMNSKEVAFKVTVTPPTDSARNVLNSVEHASRGISQMALLSRR